MRLTNRQIQELVPQVFDTAAAKMDQARRAGSFYGCCRLIEKASEILAEERRLTEDQQERLHGFSRSAFRRMFNDPLSHDAYWWGRVSRFQHEEKFESMQNARVDALLIAAAVTDLVLQGE
jgi:hypothetical protein